jgi:predicted DNA-binding protein YlxM (UPF0122 family)
MKDVARRAYLMDCYGPLLTDKQRDIYDWYYQQDLSLGEISEVAHVSRNAVYDLISRTDEKLERFEKALGLVAAAEKSELGREESAALFDRWLEENGGCLTQPARDALVGLVGRMLEAGGQALEAEGLVHASDGQMPESDEQMQEAEMQALVTERGA